MSVTSLPSAEPLAPLSEQEKTNLAERARAALETHPGSFRAGMGSGHHMMTAVYAETDPDSDAGTILVGDFLPDYVLDRPTGPKHPDHRPMMNHVIAASPETVLRLLASLEYAEQQCRDRFADGIMATYDHGKEAQRLRAAIAAHLSIVDTVKAHDEDCPYGGRHGCGGCSTCYALEAQENEALTALRAALGTGEEASDAR